MCGVFENRFRIWILVEFWFKSGSRIIEKSCVWIRINGIWTMFNLGFKNWIYEERLFGFGFVECDWWFHSDCKFYENGVQICTSECHMWFYLNQICWFGSFPSRNASMIINALISWCFISVCLKFSTINHSYRWEPPHYLTNTKLCRFNNWISRPAFMRPVTKYLLESAVY